MASKAVTNVLVTISLFGTLSAHLIKEERIAIKPFLSGLPCTAGPLGMENRAIPDSSITASSYLNYRYTPAKARLNNNGYYWLPRHNANQWIQVDLDDPTAVTGVIVNGNGGSYMRAFTVQCSRSGESDEWENLADTEGNTIEFQVRSSQPVTVNFPIALMTRFVRLIPTSWRSRIYLNFELLGCRDSLVRLVDGDGVLSGRVEIYHDDLWGVICDNDWDMREAKIVCRMLGFYEALEAIAVPFNESDEAPVVMSRVSCIGNETGLSECPFLCSGTQMCNSSLAAGVTCKLNDVIRLVDGSSASNGRVEVYQNNAWGTVCDTYWDMTDAQVVCRQLGFSAAEEAKSGAHFGQGEGPVFMDGLACDGSESKITNCPSFCWEDIRCNHTHDAGVVCRQGE